MAINGITHITIMVRDCDEALDFYVNKLGFVKREDNMIGDDFRWLTVALPTQQNFEVVLYKPAAGMGHDVEAELALVGKNPMIAIVTDNCVKTCQELKERGVVIVQEPNNEGWGVQAIFKDLYGNMFCMVEPLLR